MILIGYVLYRVSRKNSAIGFQDFLIDSIFHVKKTDTISTDTISTTVPKEQEQPRTTETPLSSSDESISKTISPVVDPMTVLEQETPVAPSPVPKIPVSAPESLIVSPSPIIVPEENVSSVEEPKEDILAEQAPEAISQNLLAAQEVSPSEIPDWLKIPETTATETVTENDNLTEKITENPVQEDLSMDSSSDVPSWLKESATIEETINPPEPALVITEDS